MTALTIEKIHKRRADVGVTECHLLRVAGLGPAFFTDLRTGAKAHVSDESLASLALALHRIQHNADCDFSERARLTDAIMRALIVLVSHLEMIDPLMVHDQSPSRRATFDPNWKKAAEIREMAFGLAASGLGLRGAQLAAAGGVSRSAITQRLRKHEDRREDAAFDAKINLLERELRGGL